METQFFICLMIVRLCVMTYGMLQHERSPSCHIPEVWDVRLKGYTGQGVVLGVVDGGLSPSNEINTQVDMELSFNFVDGNFLVQEEDIGFSHGSLCSGLIAASINRTDGCCEGVAYNARIAVLKVFATEAPYPFTPDRSVSKALTHKENSIDIYLNSWRSGYPYVRDSVPILRATASGVRKGRHGLGSIYVDISGPLDSALVNDIHTITVSSINTLDSDASACVLTTASNTVTDGHKQGLVGHTRECDNSLTDTPLEAASLVAAYIALALETNPKLTWRDVQYLIIQSSDHMPLQKYKRFRHNGSGKRFNNYYGFGLLCVAKLISMAEIWSGLPPQSVINLHSDGRYRYFQDNFQRHCMTHASRVHVPCKDTCIFSVEHVVVNTSFYTLSETHSELALISPMGTWSYLMPMHQSEYAQPTRRDDVTFTTVQFWGEISEGPWKISLKQCLPGHSRGSLRLKKRTFGLEKYSLQIYGVAQNTMSPYRSDNTHTHRARGNLESDSEASELIHVSSLEKHSILLVLACSMVILTAIVTIHCLCRRRNFKRNCYSKVNETEYKQTGHTCAGNVHENKDKNSDDQCDSILYVYHNENGEPDYTYDLNSHAIEYNKSEHNCDLNLHETEYNQLERNCAWKEHKACKELRQNVKNKPELYRTVQLGLREYLDTENYPEGKCVIQDTPVWITHDNPSLQSSYRVSLVGGRKYIESG